jgi:hypothetical protein
MLLIKSPCCHCDSQTTGSEGGHAELSDTRRSGWPTTAVILVLLHRADELVLNDRRITDKKPCSRAVGIQAQCEQYYWCLAMFKLCVPWAPRSLTDYHKTLQKEVCSNFLSRFKKLMMKAFCHVSLLGMKHWSITLNCRQEVNGMSLPIFSSETTASAGELMATVFGGENGCRRS